MGSSSPGALATVALHVWKSAPKSTAVQTKSVATMKDRESSAAFDSDRTPLAADHDVVVVVLVQTGGITSTQRPPGRRLNGSQSPRRVSPVRRHVPEVGRRRRDIVDVATGRRRGRWGSDRVRGGARTPAGRRRDAAAVAAAVDARPHEARHLPPSTPPRLGRRRVRHGAPGPCPCPCPGLQLLGAVSEDNDDRVFSHVDLVIVLDGRQQSERVGPFGRLTPHVHHAAVVVVRVDQRALVGLSPGARRPLYGGPSRRLPLSSSDCRKIIATRPRRHRSRRVPTV